MEKVINKLWEAWLEHRDTDFFDYDGLRWQRVNSCWYVIKILLPKDRIPEMYNRPIPYYKNKALFRSLL